MKRIAMLTAAVLAAGALSRLPHPAVDVGKLEPVELVYLSGAGSEIRIETDTGAIGTGRTLAEAVEDLRSSTGAVVFLDTADYLLLTGMEPSSAADLCQILRPGCMVCAVAGDVDLEAAAQYLTIHPPKQTLGDLRSGEEMEYLLTMGEGRGSLAGI